MCCPRRVLVNRSLSSTSSASAFCVATRPSISATLVKWLPSGVPCGTVMTLTWRASIAVPNGISIAATTTAVPLAGRPACAARASSWPPRRRRSRTPATAAASSAPRRFILRSPSTSSLHEIVVPGPAQGVRAQLGRAHRDTRADRSPCRSGRADGTAAAACPPGRAARRS